MYAHMGQHDAGPRHTASGRWACTGSLASAAAWPIPWTASATSTCRLGDFAQAKASYLKAIEAYREIVDPFGEGNSLAGLGDTLLGEGDPSAAQEAWRRSVAILDRLPHPLADDVRLKLRDLEFSLDRDDDAAGPPDQEQLPAAATTAR
jgi:tetratricopeptide (TPR) repeat protein